MPRLRHLDLRNYPCITTSVTFNREAVFLDTRAADILLDSIYFGRKQSWYYLLSFVIMPEHMHLIIVPLNKSISGCMKSIKGFSAREINRYYGTGMSRLSYGKKGAFWQEGFYDLILDSEEKLISRINYIEENPIRRGLVESSQEYEYSSAKCRDKTDFHLFF